MAQQLTVKDFESAFGAKLSDRIAKIVSGYEFVYEEFSEAERDAWILKILKTLQDNTVVRAGEHRLEQWERGWAENVALFAEKKDPEVAIPRYFGKYPVIRFRGKFLKPLSPHFEYQMVGVLQEWLFEEYIKNVPAIYEFGCGTGNNLLRARPVNPTATLHGFDWARSSQELIARMKGEGVETNISGARFDFFHPDRSLHLSPEGAVFTISALEQIGDRFQPFVEYLLAERPKICFHMEPISELLDPDNLLDWLSLAYLKKRNYLDDFLTYLRDLETQGKITIHRSQRSNIGSLFIESYSVIAWSPRN